VVGNQGKRTHIDDAVHVLDDVGVVELGQYRHLVCKRVSVSRVSVSRVVFGWIGEYIPSFWNVVWDLQTLIPTRRALD
jgi:hypothetical protein